MGQPAGFPGLVPGSEGAGNSIPGGGGSSSRAVDGSSDNDSSARAKAAANGAAHLATCGRVAKPLVNSAKDAGAAAGIIITVVTMSVGILPVSVHAFCSGVASVLYMNLQNGSQSGPPLKAFHNP